MKTIEMNQQAIIVYSFIIAGIGSLLPSISNIPPFLAGIVYLVSAVGLWTAYKNKKTVIIRFNNINEEPK